MAKETKIKCAHKFCTNTFIQEDKRKIYCGVACSIEQKKIDDLDYRNTHKAQEKVRRFKSYLRNKDSPAYKKKRSAYFKSWYKTHKAQQFANCKADYHRNKNKWIARSVANMLIKNSIVKTKRVCHDCGSKECQLEFTIYPKSREEIKKAIEDKKIRYVCSLHRVVKLGKPLDMSILKGEKK
jgi:hypothetical protein